MMLRARSAKHGRPTPRVGQRATCSVARQRSASGDCSVACLAMADTEQSWDFTGLKAMYINGTLKRSPEISNTEGLIEVSASIMRRHGIEVEVLRTIDHDIATGVYPDMTQHGWASDEWPQIW